MKLVLLIILLGIIPGCAPSVEVSSDYDNSVNISRYSTYNWLSGEEIEAKGLNPLYYNELTDSRIKVAVNLQMEGRGFASSDDHPPLVLHYHLVVENNFLVEPEPFGRMYGSSWPTKGNQLYPYKQGTLIIDLMDTTANILVWRGIATGVIEEEVRKNPEKAIRYAVGKMFKLFPYHR